MAYRVIQWATGGVGRAAIEGVLDHPELELVGCWVHGAAKEGKDVGELVGRAPIGVRTTRDEQAARREGGHADHDAPTRLDPVPHRCPHPPAAREGSPRVCGQAVTGISAEVKALGAMLRYSA